MIALQAAEELPFDNAGVLIDPQGRIAGSQPKSVPVPFFAHDGIPADFQEVVKTPWGHTGTYVCYDATFTDIPRRLVDMGAELLLAPLMDPERWPVQQRWQHADMAPFRSIELRRSAVRAASSGISQIVCPNGSVVAQRSREDGPGVLSGNAVFSSERTLFVRGGYLFATVVGLAYVAAVAWLTLADWRNRIRQRASVRPECGEPAL